MLDPAFDMALRGAAALLFATAAWHKLRDPVAFWQAVAAYRLLPQPLVRPVAHLIPALEALTAAALILLPGSALTVLAALSLWLLYGAAMAVNLLRGRTRLDCGCGGLSADQTIRWALVVRNGVLAGLAALALLPPGPRSIIWLDYVTGSCAALLLVLLYVSVDHLLRNHALLYSEGARP